MKAGILEKIGCLAVREVYTPRVEERAVLVKVKICSICGTDLRIYRYGDSRVQLPQILGHEIAGEIAKVGEGVTEYRVGDRVAITPRIACGECFYCCRGQYIYCQRSRTLGYQLSGGYAEYLLVPSRGVQFGALSKVADTVNFEEASLAEPLSCCLRAQKALSISPEDIVVVVGGGPVGMMHCRVAKANNAGKVIVIEKDTKRLEKVNLASVDEIVNPTKSDWQHEILALTNGRGADVVIVACSSASAEEEALLLAGRGGRISFFAGLPPGQSKISIDSNLIHYREISIRGAHGSTPRDTREALDMLAKKVLDVSDLVTHTFPLDSIEDAFLFAESRSGMRTAIVP